MNEKVSESPLEWNDTESPSLALVPGLSSSSPASEREMQLLRLGLLSGRGLSTQDAARLSGELPVSELKLRAEQYLEDCQLHNTPRTWVAKSDALRKFFWYLDTHSYETCSEREIRGFLSYIRNAHLQPGGRWQMGHGPEAQRYLKPVSRRTIEYYFVYVRGEPANDRILLRLRARLVAMDGRSRPPTARPFGKDQD